MEECRLDIFDNNKKIASAVVFILDLKSKRMALCEDLWVAPEYRNKGYAPILARLCLQKAKELKCDTFEGFVDYESAPEYIWTKFGAIDPQDKHLKIELESVIEKIADNKDSNTAKSEILKWLKQ
jgi:GNAT superfamily N-acetyltransferase